MAQKILDAYRGRGFDCICGNLRMASRAVTAVYDAHLAAAGLTSNQLAVLWPILALEPTPMGEVARNVVMDKTTVSRNIAGLVDAGLVEVRTGEDGRHRMVSTTARGRHAFAAAMPAWEAAQEEVSRIFGKARFASLVRQTRKLARAVARAEA